MRVTRNMVDVQLRNEVAQRGDVDFVRMKMVLQ